MKIAVDCRYLGKSGIGRVLEGLLDSLDYNVHEFTLIGKGELLRKYVGAHVVEDDSGPYSLAGLRSFKRELNQTCDALVIPNFLVPFGVKIPVHTIMHDLIFLDLKESTRGIKDRLIKKTLLKRCMKKSKTVACVSQFTLTRCEHYYGSLAKKCYVDHNGISQKVLEFAWSHEPLEEKENYFVFVGNVKRHKGLDVLLNAFSKLKDGSKLKIIGEKDTFLTGLKIDENAYPDVIFTGRLDDESLFEEVRRAKYLIQPSRYEGFGFPPLEALCLGTQPIVSDIPVFREVYEELPVEYFGTAEELLSLMRQPPKRVDALKEVSQRYSLKNFTETLMERVEGE